MSTATTDAGGHVASPGERWLDLATDWAQPYEVLNLMSHTLETHAKHEAIFLDQQQASRR